MSSKQSKRLLKKARASKRVKRGDLIADLLYESMKEDAKKKKKSQVVKPKVSPRQQRLLKQREELTTIQLRGRARQKARDNKPKDKAHKL